MPEYHSTMSRWMIMLLAVLALPYGYLALSWGECLVGSCRIDGHLVFYSLVGFIALPFVILTIGGGALMGGTRRARPGSASGAPTSGPTERRSRTGLRFWLGFILMIGALPACAALFYYALYTPKEGRDSLGRICETEGGATTCRADPDADRPSDLDRLNAARKRQRWIDSL